MSNFGAAIIAAAIFFAGFAINLGLTSVASSIDFATKAYLHK